MFRFTIRELVLLTLVVAMGVGWWVECSHTIAELRASRSGLNQANRKLADLGQELKSHGFVVLYFDDSPTLVRFPPHR